MLRRRRTTYPSELRPVNAIQMELGSGLTPTVAVPALSRKSESGRPFSIIQKVAPGLIPGGAVRMTVMVSPEEVHWMLFEKALVSGCPMLSWLRSGQSGLVIGTVAVKVAVKLVRVSPVLLSAAKHP